jgi:hypothetical protein
MQLHAQIGNPMPSHPPQYLPNVSGTGKSQTCEVALTNLLFTVRPIGPILRQLSQSPHSPPKLPIVHM